MELGQMECIFPWCNSYKVMRGNKREEYHLMNRELNVKSQYVLILVCLLFLKNDLMMKIQFMIPAEFHCEFVSEEKELTLKSTCIDKQC